MITPSANLQIRVRSESDGWYVLSQRLDICYSEQKHSHAHSHTERIAFLGKCKWILNHRSQNGSPWNGIAFWRQKQIGHVLFLLHLNQINIPKPYQFTFYKIFIFFHVVQMTVTVKFSNNIDGVSWLVCFNACDLSQTPSVHIFTVFNLILL